jgi:DNA-binding XRE family transcriptional regulator
LNGEARRLRGGEVTSSFPSASKTELARLAGVSAATIDRIERGEPCRMETTRKIVLALGFTLGEKDKVFPG